MRQREDGSSDGTESAFSTRLEKLEPLAALTHPSFTDAALEKDLLDLAAGQNEREGVVFGEVGERDDERVRGVEGGRDWRRGERDEESRALQRALEV